MQLREKCEKSLNILKVLSTTAWGADSPSMLRIYKATILSKLDYGCQIYGSARKSILQKLDPIHHAALRLYSGAFRTSPVQSLYPLRGTSSSDVTGFTTPRYPTVWPSFKFHLPSTSCF
ncbi:hypothetical protein AVEN_21766-1 [Araneus ventricosus]|uniref:Reverse transcriptase domain-containing protein n=1 Tax=Araneus ventricosus TaxID=182803 RepID=A0A4Y2NKU6_ARAVE|nr:hypothetical protein AVEN_21766-1 [Araneus ventricosus]